MKKLKHCIVALGAVLSLPSIADGYNPTENWIEYSKSDLSGKTLQCIERAESYEKSYDILFTEILKEFHRKDVNYRFSDLMSAMPGLIDKLPGIEYRKELKYHWSAVNYGKVGFDTNLYSQAVNDNEPKKVAKILTESIKFNCLELAGIMYP